MKDVFIDPVKGIEVMERITLIHDLLTELRKQVKVIELDYFSLIGEEFGELTVLSRADRMQVVDGAETHYMGWRCHCTCGESVIVDHQDLVTNKQTNCEGEQHE